MRLHLFFALTVGRCVHAFNFHTRLTHDTNHTVAFVDHTVARVPRTTSWPKARRFVGRELLGNTANFLEFFGTDFEVPQSPSMEDFEKKSGFKVLSWMLAEGGFGGVYKASSHGQVVALKAYYREEDALADLEKEEGLLNSIEKAFKDWGLIDPPVVKVLVYYCVFLEIPPPESPSLAHSVQLAPPLQA